MLYESKGKEENEQRDRGRKFSHALSQEIEIFGKELIAIHPFFKEIKKKKLSKRTLAFYLYNLEKIVTETVPNLQLAIAKGKELQLSPDFIRALEKKIDEELGHELWAQNDLRILLEEGPLDVGLSLLSSMEKFIIFIREVAKSFPLSYFVYAYFIEELMVTIGPEVLDFFEIASGIKKENFTIISQHIEFDQGHAEEGGITLETFLIQATDGEMQEIEAVKEETKRFIWNFFQDLYLVNEMFHH